MLAVWQMAFSLIQACLALYGAFYIFVAIFKPRYFLDWHSIDRDGEGMALYIKAACTFIGLAILGFNAAAAIVAPIPANWGGLDEYGEFVSKRESIQLLVASLTIFLPSRLEDIAEAILREPCEREAKRSLLWALYAQKQATCLTSEQTGLVLSEARQRYTEKVTPDWVDRSKWAGEIRQDVLNNISLDRREVDRW